MHHLTRLYAHSKQFDKHIAQLDTNAQIPTQLDITSQHLQHLELYNSRTHTKLNHAHN